MCVYFSCNACPTILHHVHNTIRQGGKPSPKDLGCSISQIQYNKYKSRYVSKSGLAKQPSVEHGKFSGTFSKKQALAEDCSEMGIEECTDPLSSLSLDVQMQLETRAQLIFEHWKHVRQSPPLRECWNCKDGGFVREALECENDPENSVNDECYVPIVCLLDWLKNYGITDLAAGRMKSLYDGLRQIPTDASSILESLIDLSCAKSLYKIPPITPYAVARRVVQNNSGTRWKIRIGVYMNRLLPEVLTMSTLHCIMSALDDGSFIVTEPLHMPPLRNRDDPVFESSRYPIVRLPGVQYDENLDIDEEGMSMDKEKKEDDVAPIWK